MATAAFIENDEREKLNLVDEAAALTKIRDILSGHLGREATAKEVADEVAKKDEQRIGRLLRFHEAPKVVKEGVLGQRLVAKSDNREGALLNVVKTPAKGQKTIDLHAALEFCRLHKHFAATTRPKADEKTNRIIERARVEGWSLRRIQGYVKAIVSGTAKLPTVRSVFSDDQQRFTVYLSRLTFASAELRAELRLKLTSILNDLDRIDDQPRPSDPSGSASSDGEISAD
jgi:hypothetical protein